MKDQINASKILHSSAIYTQSMKITRPLRKRLLMIKSVKTFFYTEYHCFQKEIKR